ncbi:uncharacterized protein LOC111674183 [Orussus abietinus]|uniref:uncharacterized protein LOC111674183 n=1 Tax=Orussus abietinus TaxID=222816 RepID=UPI000C715B12|nr:uncharacterized protein LOC111674183 [Orussus abietinus]
MSDTQKYVNLLKNSIPEISNRNRLSKRGAPLSFVGTISKALFGTLSSEDAEYYNQQLNQLEMDQSHLSQIVGNQTHIVRSEFQNIHQRLDNLTQETTRCLEVAKGIAKELNQQSLEKHREAYKTAIWRWITALGSLAQEYRSGILLITDVVLFARQGILHPAILSPEQLEKSVSLIQETSPLEFPLSTQELLTGSLNHLAEVQTQYQENRLILILSFPLLDKEPFQLYKVYPIPTQQPYGTAKPIAAYVLPRSPYFALSEDQNYYFTPEEQYIQQCLTHRHDLLCELTIPLHKTESSTNCEIQLLTRPQETQWRTCDLKLTTPGTTFWQKLPAPNSWLYSAIKSDTLKVHCRNKITDVEEIQGQGILQLAPGCKAITPSTRLTATREITTNTAYRYAPPVWLNLTSISGPIAEPHLLAIDNLAKELSLGNSTQNWENGKNGMALARLEEEAHSIQVQQQNKIHRQLTNLPSS